MNDVIIKCEKCQEELLVVTSKYDNSELAEIGLGPVNIKIMVRCDLCPKKHFTTTHVNGTFSISSPDDINFEPISDIEADDIILLRAWRT